MHLEKHHLNVNKTQTHQASLTSSLGMYRKKYKTLCVIVSFSRCYDCLVFNFWLFSTHVEVGLVWSPQQEMGLSSKESAEVANNNKTVFSCRPTKHNLGRKNPTFLITNRVFNYCKTLPLNFSLVIASTSTPPLTWDKKQRRQSYFPGDSRGILYNP